jgi:putative SOS response-associated peptidase YedK
MCYDIKAKLESQLEYAKRFGDEEAIKKLQEQLAPYWDGDHHVVSGFAHPTVLVYHQQHPSVPQFVQWGLRPFWAKTGELAKKLSNSGINARSETMFDKPMFRKAASYGRALLWVDGFFEHHHTAKRKIPFFIQRADRKPMCIAAICDVWKDPQTEQLHPTFSIVTTKGNELLSKIHNNPKLDEPRMPVVLDEHQIEDYLMPVNGQYDKKYVRELCLPFPSEELEAHPVHPIRGKIALGNVPEATDPVEYDELKENSPLS